MRIIVNTLIPFNGFKAINLFSFVFTKKKLSAIDINHEYIHTLQMKELLYIGFYVWYFVEWLIRLLIYYDFYKAYRCISFEKEAYSNEDNLNYLRERKKFNFINYILWQHKY